MPLLWSILANALRHRHRVAVIDDRRTLTYGQLLGGAFFVAEAIDRLTDRPHVGIMLPTSGAFPVSLLGAWLARRTAVPLNYLLSEDELNHVVRDSGIDTILTAGPMLDFLGPRSWPEGVKRVRLETLDFTGVPPLRWPPIVRGDDLAVLIYTSGTSGRPKGVMLTHANLGSNTRACLRKARVSPEDVLLGVLPQFHCYGLTALTLLPLLVGAKVVYTARFVPKKLVELMREHRPTVFMAVPSMYGALLSVKEASAQDLASLRFVVSGGEPLPLATFEAFADRFGVRLLEGYGLTETSPVTHWSTPEPGGWKLHSVGRPLEGVSVVTLDEDGRALPPGAGVDGEVVIHGPNVMKGYYRLPSETSAAFIDTLAPASAEGPGMDGLGDKRGWFRTGDVGRIDAEGFLFITGRRKEMFKVAGEMVAPREVEEALNRHPAVKDSAVIPMADGLRGLVPLAFVELWEGRAFDAAELRSWCRERLAGYKVPREVRRVDQLPRSPTGKILKRQLSAG